MDNLAEKTSDRRREGYAVVRALLGALLLTTATLKAYQLGGEIPGTRTDCGRLGSLRGRNG